MQKIYLPFTPIRVSIVAFLLFLGLLPQLLSAQSATLSPREIWCGLASLSEPNVKNYKDFCSRLVEAYPSSLDLANNTTIRKIYLTKMRGFLKRGMTWDVLSPTERTELSREANDLTAEYLSYAKGQVNPTPKDYQRGNLGVGKACEETSLEYDNLGECYGDCSYEEINYISNANISPIQKFWGVLKFLACNLECDKYLKK